MIINLKNANIINTENFYIHDDILYELCFERKSKTLVLSVGKNPKNEMYRIKICGVAGFAMTDCAFWGASERICDMEYVTADEQVLMPRLKEKYSEVKNDGELALQECFETVIVFISGDELRIACKSIEVEDRFI